MKTLLLCAVLALMPSCAGLDSFLMAPPDLPPASQPAPTVDATALAVQAVTAVVEQLKLQGVEPGTATGADVAAAAKAAISEVADDLRADFKAKLDALPVSAAADPQVSPNVKAVAGVLGMLNENWGKALLGLAGLYVGGRKNGRQGIAEAVQGANMADGTGQFAGGEVLQGLIKAALPQWTFHPESPIRAAAPTPTPA